ATPRRTMPRVAKTDSRGRGKAPMVAGVLTLPMRLSAGSRSPSPSITPPGARAGSFLPAVGAGQPFHRGAIHETHLPNPSRNRGRHASHHRPDRHLRSLAAEAQEHEPMGQAVAG